MYLDPATTNPGHYKIVFENERVRVLEYRDDPGDQTTPHDHPDSVMYTLAGFKRRLYADGSEREVEIAAGVTAWLSAQRHSGHNVGDSPTHVIFVELNEQRPGPAGLTETIGPSGI